MLAVACALCAALIVAPAAGALDLRAPGLVNVSVTQTPAAPPGPKPLPQRSSVQLGAAVWYGCTTSAYSGPAPLACQVAPSAAATPSAYLSTWAQRFDRLTPENELKMLWTEPKNGQFDFSTADAEVRLAQSAGRHVRGHTLIYAAANPGWVDRPLLPWSRNTLLKAMQNHISTEVTHFRSSFPGVIDEWDVVNEPFTDSGTRDQNVYQRVIGDDWIEQAFRAARAADPDAVLMLNEFNADTPGPRQRAVLALARDFVARGVPLDGIGLEMHVGADGVYPSIADIKSVMSSYAQLGLRVEATEADALQPVVTDGGMTQRNAYDVIAEACRESPNCTGVTVWGVADAYSWRGPAQHATLFDAPITTGQFSAKVAAGAPLSTYEEVRCRLAHPWATAAAPAGPDPCAITG